MYTLYRDLSVQREQPSERRGGDLARVFVGRGWWLSSSHSHATHNSHSLTHKQQTNNTLRVTHSAGQLLLLLIARKKHTILTLLHSYMHISVGRTLEKWLERAADGHMDYISHAGIRGLI